LPFSKLFDNIQANPNFIFIRLTNEGEFCVAINPVTYIRESYEELQKVVWPKWPQTLRLTVVVLIVSIIVGAYIAGIDSLFTKATSIFIKGR